MKTLALIVLLFSAQSFAQDAIPLATILPVQLNSSLRSNKARPGQAISARLMQDVPLGRSTIRAGAKVTGHVVAIQPASATGSGQISLRFDELVVSRRRIPVATNLRALASMMDVSEAQVPVSGPDRGTSEYSWSTDQIGGEYRSGGIVVHGSRVVGQWGGGALVRPASKPGTNSRAEVDDNHQPQALWVFSSDACGIYGLSNVVLVHAGRTDPVGEITVRSRRGDLHIAGGSGLLLRLDRAQ